MARSQDLTISMIECRSDMRLNVTAPRGSQRPIAFTEYLRFMFKIVISLLLLINGSYLHAQSGTGICPDSIIIFQLNDLEFDFTIEGIDDGETVQWDFGDGPVVVGTENEQHVFSEGTFLITAIFMDADCPWDGPTALSVEITVTPCWLSLSYVQRNEGLFTFTATGFPEVYPMYWEMGDGTQIVETWVVDHQYAPGIYEACAWVVTSFCYDTMYACIEVTINDVGTFDREYNQVVNIYPSPANEFITIEKTHGGIGVVEIFDIYGQRIIAEKLSDHLTRVEVSSWPPGLYSVRYSNDRHKLSRKILISRE